MAKKTSLFSLYFIGMVLVVVGCFLPLTGHKFLFSFNGPSVIDAITSKSNGILKTGSLLAIIGAIAGIVFCFVSIKNVPMKLISLIVTIAGGLFVLFNYLTASDLAKGAAKLAGNLTGAKPSIGLFIIIAGWVIALLGYFKEK